MSHSHKALYQPRITTRVMMEKFQEKRLIQINRNYRQQIFPIRNENKTRKSYHAKRLKRFTDKGKCSCGFTTDSITVMKNHYMEEEGFLTQ